MTTTPSPIQIIPGSRVRFHPIIGGNHDGKLYTVKLVYRKRDGTTTVILSGMKNKVDIRALSLPAPGFRVVDPLT